MNEEELILICPPEADGERLDRFLGDTTELSRSYAAKLAQDGRITDETGRVLGKKEKLKAGQCVTVSLPEPEDMKLVAEDIPLMVVYEDDQVIVINKPQGMVVHPAPGNPSGTLVNALMYHCGDSLSAINGVNRPGIVHRIDKDTSGLLMVAKSNEAHLFLSEQLKDRKALRQYVALVNGNIREDTGTIRRPIARHPSDRKRMAVIQGGREAVTHFKVMEHFSGYTLVECTLETGRTHQIRVHLASVGHSIVGDPVYGIKQNPFHLNGQLLHAKTIGFLHPTSGQLMTFNSELPEYFTVVLDKLRAKN